MFIKISNDRTINIKMEDWDMKFCFLFGPGCDKIERVHMKIENKPGYSVGGRVLSSVVCIYVFCKHIAVCMYVATKSKSCAVHNILFSSLRREAQ